MENNQLPFSPSPASSEPVMLSPSALNIFLECPRCFWLYKARGIHRPAGPMSSLPSGLDLLIKDYFDHYRAQAELPPEIKGKVEGRLLPDQGILNNWRNWRTSNLKYEDRHLNAVLRGALDECFILEQTYIPVDYKTRGFALKQDSTKYYQNQLNCYALLLKASGFKPAPFGYLIFYIPQKLEANGLVHFRIEPRKVETNPQAAKALFEEAIALLQKPAPASHSTCQFCAWSNDWLRFE